MTLPPAPPAPSRGGSRPLAIPAGLAGVALACAALLAVQDTASSRMLLWPWQLLYWLGPLAAGGALMLSLPGATRLSHAWCGALLAGATSLIVATAASPWRDQILPWCAWPLTLLALAATGARLLADPTNGARRECLLLVALGIVGTALSITSLTMWLAELAPRFDTIWRVRNPHPLSHANYTAGTGLLFLPILIGLACSSRGLRRAGWSVASVLCLAMLLSGGSRGAFLGLAATTAVAFALAWRARRLPRSALVVGALLAVSLGAMQPGVRNGLLPPPSDSPVNMSNAQRSTWIDGGLAAVAERPLVGWGTGATPWFFPNYRGRLDYGPYTVLQLHNTPLQLWAESGALALLAALALASLVGLGLWRECSQIPSSSPRLSAFKSPALRSSAFWPAVASLAGYGVFAITDYQLDLPLVSATLGLLLAVVAARSTLPANPRPGLMVRAGMVVSAILLVGLAWIAVGQLRLRAALERDDWQTALRIAPGDAALRLYAADRLLHSTDGTPTAPDARREQALALLDANAAENLIPELTRCLSGWARLGHDPATASRDFAAAVAVAPNHHSALLGAALAALSLGQRERAVAMLTRACLARPRFLASGWWRMTALAELRSQVEARLQTTLNELATDSAVRPSIRREAEYLRALIDWCAGNDEAGAALIAKATNPARRAFWARLLDQAGDDSAAPFPADWQSLFALVEDPADQAWQKIVRATLGPDLTLAAEQALVHGRPLPELVRAAMSPTTPTPWPYYQRRGTRAGFQVNHRHPRLQGVNDGGIHRENLWADLLLTPLWPEEFWLPDSLLSGISPPPRPQPSPTPSARK